MRVVAPLLATIAAVGAFAPSSPAFTRSGTALSAEVSRMDFVRTTAAAALAVAVSSSNPLAAFADDDEIKLKSGTVIKVVKKGTGPKPTVGTLAGIRFKANAGSIPIDDIFGTQEPYYTRVGSGGLLKGVEEVLPMMVVGDRWILTIPVSAKFRGIFSSDGMHGWIRVNLLRTGRNCFAPPPLIAHTSLSPPSRNILYRYRETSHLARRAGLLPPASPASPLTLSSPSRSRWLVFQVTRLSSST
jgi:hypothetical protein